MKHYFRFRHLFMILGTISVLVYLYITDPNDGMSLVPFIGALASPVIAVWFAHLARKALFDYIDMATLHKKAKETATGAALTFVGICIVIYGLLGLFGSKVFGQELPTNAYTYLPTVQIEKNLYWSDHPKRQPLEH